MTPNTHHTNPHNTTKKRTQPPPHTTTKKRTQPRHNNAIRPAKHPKKKLSSHPYHLFIAHYDACDLTVEASSTDRRTENMTRP